MEETQADSSPAEEADPQEEASGPPAKDVSTETVSKLVFKWIKATAKSPQEAGKLMQNFCPGATSPKQLDQRQLNDFAFALQSEIKAAEAEAA